MTTTPTQLNDRKGRPDAELHRGGPVGIPCVGMPPVSVKPFWTGGA